jgi:hypothetical protein
MKIQKKIIGKRVFEGESPTPQLDPKDPAVTPDWVTTTITPPTEE